MASKKKSKESKKRRWPSPPAPGGGLPESTRSRLWELFGQIEHEFELIHSENAACELVEFVRYRNPAMARLLRLRCSVATERYEGSHGWSGRKTRT